MKRIITLVLAALMVMSLFACVSAEETAALEDEAKHNPGKDSVALFAPGSGNVYSWDTFQDEIMGKKLAALQQFFSTQDNDRGTAFLYRILALLREVQGDPQK